MKNRIYKKLYKRQEPRYTQENKSKKKEGETEKSIYVASSEQAAIRVIRNKKLIARMTYTRIDARLRSVCDNLG